MNSLALFLTVFVACAVEAVEALTIVLAAGVTREWRSALQGMAAALAVLAVAVAVIGPALTLVPLTGLRLVVGALLAVFGLQWLRKAILRASGYKDLHDEGAIYARQVAAANDAARQSRRGVRDWYAFTLSFKGVLLEGLEVVFIAITFGDNQQNLGLVAMAAAAAVLVVAAVGIAVLAPLSRVPENTMKFAVGIMLTSFGVFWGAEGAGVSWPGNDAALLAVVPVTALVALTFRGPAAPGAPGGPSGHRCPGGEECRMKQVAAPAQGVLVRLRHRRRLARASGGGGRAGRDRAAGARGLGERLVANAGRGDSRARLARCCATAGEDPGGYQRRARLLRGRGLRPGHLVGEDYRLYSVAEAELGQHPADMGLHRRSDTNSRPL